MIASKEYYLAIRKKHLLIIKNPLLIKGIEYDYTIVKRSPEQIIKIIFDSQYYTTNMEVLR